MILKAFQPNDTSLVMQVWLRSVTATHDFLTKRDIDFYYHEIEQQYLAALEIYVAINEHGELTGFIGMEGHHIQMLFVDSCYFGCAIGKQLLALAETKKGHLILEVNEQNPHALSFYLSQGFKEIGRSEFDSSGRPFPLIHLSK